MNWLWRILVPCLLLANCVTLGEAIHTLCLVPSTRICMYICAHGCVFLEVCMYMELTGCDFHSFERFRISNLNDIWFRTQYRKLIKVNLYVWGKGPKTSTKILQQLLIDLHRYLEFSELCLITWFVGFHKFWFYYLSLWKITHWRQDIESMQKFINVLI